MLSFLQTITRPMFGTFEREEYKKFLRMGLIFTTIIGAYWTMRGLKKAIFFKLADATQIPFAKTASIFFLFPVVILYNKLLDRYPRERMFYLLSIFYGTALILFAIAFYFVQATPEVVAARTGFASFGTAFLGYAWYVFVESFGSLVVALFWAIASDTTSPDSAKKGFSLVVAIGQMGGIFLPDLIGRLPKWFGLETDMAPVFICGVFALLLFLLMRWFLSATPKHLLTHAFEAQNTQTVEKEQEPGFFEGLKILVKNNYLLGIFAVISFFEIIVTIFDYNFDCKAQAVLGKGAALTEYTLTYASYVNIVALVCLLLGVSNITRYLGVNVALALMPLIMAGAIFGFLTYDNLNFFFWLMVSSKAINYALNGPALKQLYIPISKDARFKSQAWIETFGSRGAKEAGSVFNMCIAPVVLGFIGFAFVGLWFFAALFLGKTYNKAITDKKLIC